MVTNSRNAETIKLPRVFGRVGDYFSFTDVIEPSQYRRRILVMTAAAVVSLFFFQIDALHSLIVFGVAVALTALIVRRLRAGGMPWWLVFLGLIPVVGWIILAALVSRLDGEQTDAGRVKVAKAVVPFVATLVVLALLVVSATLAVGREDTI